MGLPLPVVLFHVIIRCYIETDIWATGVTSGHPMKETTDLVCLESLDKGNSARFLGPGLKYGR